MLDTVLDAYRRYMSRKNGCILRLNGFFVGRGRTLHPPQPVILTVDPGVLKGLGLDI